METAYDNLTEHYQQIADLQHVYAISSWDEAAMMPTGGGDARGQALATLGVVIHGLVTDKRVGEWLDGCSNLELDNWQQANLREMRRQYDQAICVPAELVRRSSIANSRCEQAWRRLRAENNWGEFEPLLEEVVSAAREAAAARSETSELGLYDSLLDLFEPGMRSSTLDELFAELKVFLPDFASEVIERQQQNPPQSLGDYFSQEQQRALGLEVMTAMGFDFDHGRLDISHHPFCGGVHEDVRITTRYTTDNFVESLMAVIHETGHAMYEQGRPGDWSGQPVSEARSSGVHESQSLLMEMQACRSRGFLDFLAPITRRVFEIADDNPAWQAENLYRLYTQVSRGYIRVDADEITYPLHVILRYEIEQPMIEGDIQVADIPDLWNDKMQEYLKIDTKGNFTDGCMQDVHWSAGLFGYFPTYTLGAMMAAQIFASAKSALPQMADDLGKGDFSALVSWLRDKVHGQGSLHSVDGLMTHATGSALQSHYFINHLKDRYG